MRSNAKNGIRNSLKSKGLMIVSVMNGSSIIIPAEGNVINAPMTKNKEASKISLLHCT